MFYKYLCYVVKKKCTKLCKKAMYGSGMGAGTAGIAAVAGTGGAALGS